MIFFYFVINIGILFMWYNTARYAEKHMLCRYVPGRQTQNRQYVFIKCADLQIESHYSINIVWIEKRPHCLDDINVVSVDNRRIQWMYNVYRNIGRYTFGRRGYCLATSCKVDTL